MARPSVFSITKKLRDRWHPLFYLRRSRAFRFMLERFDFPVWLNLYAIPHLVCIRLARHASCLLNSRTTEPEIVSLFLAIQKVYTPKVFWDVGAYVGYYSWLLKGMDPTIQVVMFEPDDVNRSVIEKTLARSGLIGVHIDSAAVSDSDGENTFSLDRLTGATGSLENPARSFMKRHYNINPSPVQVTTVTIDSVRQTTSSVDLIKIDVEGHEAKVFTGAERTLQQDHPILIFECFAHDRVILDNLVDKGYRLYDAERMSASLVKTTNYLAIPAHCHAKTDLLFYTWREKKASLWES